MVCLTLELLLSSRRRKSESCTAGFHPQASRVTRPPSGFPEPLAGLPQLSREVFQPQLVLVGVVGAVCVPGTPKQQQVPLPGHFWCQAPVWASSLVAATVTLLERRSSPLCTGELTEAEGGGPTELGVRALRAGPCSGVCWALGRGLVH